MKTGKNQVENGQGGSRTTILSLRAGLAAAVILWPIIGGAVAVRIPNQDPEAIARGNAFVATADDPAAIYYNPAGITQLPGDDVSVGLLNYFGVNGSYDSFTGGHADTKFRMIQVPQVHYTHQLQDLPLTLGFGLYAPYGLDTQWPDNSSFRTLAIKSSLQYITLNPVVAWKVSDSLSVAAGPQLDYSEIYFDRGLFTANDNLAFKARGISAGFNAGIRWQPISELSFGATYRSFSTIQYRGNTTYNGAPPAATKATLTYPQSVSFGGSYRPTTNWNVEVDADWTDWSSARVLTLQGSSAIFGIDLPMPLWWHPSWFYEIGLTRQFADGWFASCGYFYSTETTSTGSFNPSVPDTALHVGSVGIGRHGRRWNWAVAAQIITGPDRVVSGSAPSPTGQTADGRYQLVVPTMSASLGYHF